MKPAVNKKYYDSHVTAGNSNGRIVHYFIIYFPKLGEQFSYETKAGNK